MKPGASLYWVLGFSLLLAGCAATGSKQEIMAAGSQVEVRSYQMRSYDTTDKRRVLRAVLATLQDLRFVIEKADDTVGLVSATKLDGYRLSMSVTVRSSNGQTVVRANAQYNLQAIEEPGPYQDFFKALDKGLFLEDNLLADVGDAAQKAAVTPETLAQGDAEAVASNSGAPVTAVFRFYGEAEAEVIEGTQDLDLWALALVEVEGDEQRRKVRYIELRAEQLYAESLRRPTVSPAQPVTARLSAGSARNDAAPLPDEVPSVAGTYETIITTNASQIFGRKYRNLTLVVEQNGRQISGYDRRFGTRLSGEIDDDVIRFEVDNGTASGHYPARGEWRLAADGRSLEGTWKTHGGWVDASGTWDMIRIN